MLVEDDMVLVISESRWKEWAARAEEAMCAQHGNEKTCVKKKTLENE